jgi:beta-galactosidase
MYESIEKLIEWSRLVTENYSPDHTGSNPSGERLLGIGKESLGESIHANSLPAIPTPLHPLERPVILCEYSHAMGNSNGSLHEYFHVFKTMPGIQGGFIWEWADHAILQKTADGREFYAYGGDFGDVPNDANFVCDGLVSADRQPHPAMWEFKHLAQPVAVELVNVKHGVIRVRNEQDFTSLDWIRATWELLQDGVPRKRGTLPKLDIGPGEAREFTIPLPSPEPGTECHINVRFETRRDTLYAKRGHEIAFAQLPLPANKARTNRPARVKLDSPISVEETDRHLILKAGETRLCFDRVSATLSSLSHAGHELLARGPVLQLWRGPTDNDGIKLWTGQHKKVLAKWQALGLDKPLLHLPCSFEWKPNRQGTITVTLSHSAWNVKSANNAIHTHRYTFYPDARLLVENDIALSGSAMIDLPRVGISLRLVPGYERLRYFGRGPWENYSDRNTSALVGLYNSTVSDQYVPYVLPQEHGHRTGVRWLELRADKQMPAVRLQGSEPFEMNVTHHSAEDLYTAKHTIDLQPSPETIVYLDAGHRGVGTNSCGPDTLPTYRLLGQRYQFSYELTLV